MKLLADENIARAILVWLRAKGCDVLSAAESMAQEMDAALLQTAEAEGRLVLTEDKDFGELVFRDHLTSHDVILLRTHRLTVDQRVRRLNETWSVIEANPSGRFIVITETKVRVRPLSHGSPESPLDSPELP